MPFASGVAFDQREHRRMLDQRSITSAARHGTAPDGFPQLDEIIWGWHRNEQVTAWCEDARAFRGVTPAVEREHELHAAVEKGQAPIGIGDNPRHRWNVPRGVRRRSG